MYTKNSTTCQVFNVSDNVLENELIDRIDTVEHSPLVIRLCFTRIHVNPLHNACDRACSELPPIRPVRKFNLAIGHNG